MIDIRVEPDGLGCASLGTERYEELTAAAVRAEIEATIGGPAILLGTRFVDGDGRDVHGVVEGGHVLIGFRSPIGESRPVPPPKGTNP